MKTVLITAIAIIAIAIQIISSIRKKRRNLSLQKDGILDDSRNIDREDQNEKNVSFVSQIIFGNCFSTSGKTKRKSIRAFERWQNKENQLWDRASYEQRELLAEYMNGVKDKHSFVPIIQSENPCKESRGYPCGYELFVKNAFTDPFPSLHDMPEWAIGNKIVELFIAHNVSIEDSCCYLFHLKRHYVNHGLTQAIIQFDLWKIPNPKIRSRFPNRVKQFIEGTGDW